VRYSEIKNTMDHIFIKEEIEDTYDTVSLSSASESYSSRSSTTSSSPSCSISASSSISFPPTQRVLPARQGVGAGIVDGGGGLQHFRQNTSETMRSKPPSLKRSGSEIATSRSKHHRSQSSLMSPLLPTGPSLHSPSTNLAIVAGYQQNQEVGTGPSMAQDGGVTQEDEWKNIKVVRRNINILKIVSHLKLYF
jgi:hypothetical protein